VPRSKQFSFLNYGDGAKAAAEVYQCQIAKDYELEFKNQYRHRVDPNDGLPYIEFRVRNTAGKDSYPMCDVEDLPLLGEHTWYIQKNGSTFYVSTNIEIDGKKTTKYFHNFKCPDWPKVDHYSEIKKQNRNGLDNRNKHLRDGSGGVNEGNCKLYSSNTSGASGVDYYDRNKCWRVRDQTVTRARFRPMYFHGPKDKTHPSYHAACAYQREQAANVGNTNGQMPEDSD